MGTRRPHCHPLRSRNYFPGPLEGTALREVNAGKPWRVDSPGSSALGHPVTCGSY